MCVGLVLEYAKELLLFSVTEASKHQNLSFEASSLSPLVLGQLLQGLLGSPHSRRAAPTRPQQAQAPEPCVPWPCLLHMPPTKGNGN